MKNKGLLFLAILLFVGNAFAVKPYVTVVNKIDTNIFGPDQDIWVHFDTLSSKCFHKCSYHRIKPGDDYIPTGSVLGNLLTVVTYLPGRNGKIERIKFPTPKSILSSISSSFSSKKNEEFSAQTNKVEVSLDPQTRKFIFKDVGSKWNLTETKGPN